MSGAASRAARLHFERSELGRRVLAGRPFPERGTSALPRVEELSWQVRATRCRDADETTSFVLVEAEYQSDVGEGDLQSLCGYCPVAFECLTAGVAMHGSGVWGGIVLDDGRPAPGMRPTHAKAAKNDQRVAILAE